MFVTDQQAAELPQPCVGSLDLPASFVAPQLPAVFIFPLLVVSSIGRDQLDTPSFPSLSQRVRVVAPICDHPFRLLPRSAFWPGDADLVERGVRKCNFCRRGTFQPNSQRNTFTVSQYHPLRAFATLGFADRIAPFLAGAKLPSRKASSQCNRPSASKAPSNVRQALSQMPSSSHCFNRRQQVDGDGYASGRKRHAAPVCNTHRMPSKQPRFGAGGRPRPSRRRFGSGSSGPTSSHCASVNTFCRFFMTEAQHCIRLTSKCLT